MPLKKSCLGSWGQPQGGARPQKAAALLQGALVGSLGAYRDAVLVQGPEGLV